MVPDISIIVPIYNQERFLYDSLLSIKNNLFTNYEVILVNDGSTDQSEKICKKFCDEDSRFKYLRKDNNGVASARQFGLNVSNGKYLIHVDPDDRVEPDYLSEMFINAISTKADIVICDYFEEYDEQTKIVSHRAFCGMTLQDLKLELAEGAFWGVCWNKLIKSDIIKGKVDFAPHINFQEDKLFIFRALCEAKKVSFVQRPLYHYNRANPDSILTSITFEKAAQVWPVRQLILAEESGLFNRLRLSNRLINLRSVMELTLSEGVSNADFQKTINQFRLVIFLKSISQRRINLKTRLIGLFSSLGVSVRVFQFVMRIKHKY